MSDPEVDDEVMEPEEVMPQPSQQSITKTPEMITAEQEKEDEYKETWLKMWTNTTNPKHVSCVTAFDIVAWCFGPVNQLRSMYRTGKPTVCTEQFNDLKLCMKVFAKSTGDNAAIGREMLRADRRAKEDPRPHIFPMRTQPPSVFQFRLSTQPTDQTAK